MSDFYRQVVGSRETALETVLVLRQVVSKARFQNIQQLVEIIGGVGRKLVEAQPKGVNASYFCTYGIIETNLIRIYIRTHGRKYRSQNAASPSRGIQQRIEGHDHILLHIFHIQIRASGPTAQASHNAEDRIDSGSERERSR